MVTLTEVYKDSEPEALHVIFIHGLDGHAQTTWMHDPADDATLWPRWIGVDVGCNVWVAAYCAASSAWSAPAMHLFDQGNALIDAIQAEPRLQGHKLVLVGHSLGGLVIKSGLTHAESL